MIECITESSTDGSVVTVERNTYDSYGNLTKIEMDTDNNQIIDITIIYVYGPNGSITAKEWHYEDVLPFSSIAYYYIYGENGKIIQTEHDDNYDFVIDTIVEYFYDENGYNTKLEERYNSSGEVFLVTKFTYDANKNLIVKKFDYSETEIYKYDTEVRYTFDSIGNMIKEELDVGSDGTIDMLKKYTYDSNGNLAEEEVNETVDYIKSYTWKRLPSSNSGGCFLETWVPLNI